MTTALKTDGDDGDGNGDGDGDDDGGSDCGGCDGDDDGNAMVTATTIAIEIGPGTRSVNYVENKDGAPTRMTAFSRLGALVFTAVKKLTVIHGIKRETARAEIYKPRDGPGWDI